MDERSAITEVIHPATDLLVFRMQIRFPSTHDGLVSRMRLQPESFTQPPGSSPWRGQREQRTFIGGGARLRFAVTPVMD